MLLCRTVCDVAVCRVLLCRLMLRCRVTVLGVDGDRARCSLLCYDHVCRCGQYGVRVRKYYVVSMIQWYDVMVLRYGVTVVLTVAGCGVVLSCRCWRWCDDGVDSDDEQCCVRLRCAARVVGCCRRCCRCRRVVSSCRALLCVLRCVVGMLRCYDRVLCVRLCRCYGYVYGVMLSVTTATVCMWQAARRPGPRPPGPPGNAQSAKPGNSACQPGQPAARPGALAWQQSRLAWPEPECPARPGARSPAPAKPSGSSVVRVRFRFYAGGYGWAGGRAYGRLASGVCLRVVCRLYGRLSGVLFTGCRASGRAGGRRALTGVFTLRLRRRRRGRVSSRLRLRRRRWRRLFVGCLLFVYGRLSCLSLSMFRLLAFYGHGLLRASGGRVGVTGVWRRLCHGRASLLNTGVCHGRAGVTVSLFLSSRHSGVGRAGVCFGRHGVWRRRASGVRRRRRRLFVMSLRFRWSYRSGYGVVRAGVSRVTAFVTLRLNTGGLRRLLRLSLLTSGVSSLALHFTSSLYSYALYGRLTLGFTGRHLFRLTLSLHSTLVFRLFQGQVVRLYGCLHFTVCLRLFGLSCRLRLLSLQVVMSVVVFTVVYGHLTVGVTVCHVCLFDGLVQRSNAETPNARCQRLKNTWNN